MSVCLVVVVVWMDGWMDLPACLPVSLSAGWLLRKQEGGQGSGGEEGDDTRILSVVLVVYSL